MANFMCLLARARGYTYLVKYYSQWVWEGVFCFVFFNFPFLPFLGPLPRHMEVPRLGVELELLLLAYARATAKRGPELCLQPTPQFTATPDP